MGLTIRSACSLAPFGRYPFAALRQTLNVNLRHKNFFEDFYALQKLLSDPFALSFGWEKEIEQKQIII